MIELEVLQVRHFQSSLGVLDVHSGPFRTERAVPRMQASVRTVSAATGKVEDWAHGRSSLDIATSRICGHEAQT